MTVRWLFFHFFGDIIKKNKEAIEFQIPNKEIACLSEEGRKILNDTLEYEMLCCSVGIRNITEDKDVSLDEIEKPEKICISNGDVIKRLKAEYGIKIKNVSGLNEILQEMGLIRISLDKGYCTDEGMKYSIFWSSLIPTHIWIDDVVPLIAKYVKDSEK